MNKVDALQVIISTSAIFGIGLVWFNLNQKVFKTVCSLAAAPFSRPKKEADYSSDSSDSDVEAINCSDIKDGDDDDDDLCDYCGKRPKLSFDLRVSSPFFDEADMKRLEGKGLKKVIAEMLNLTLIDNYGEKTD